MKKVNFEKLEKCIEAELNANSYTLSIFKPNYFGAENTAHIRYVTNNNEEVDLVITCFENYPFTLLQYLGNGIVLYVSPITRSYVLGLAKAIEGLDFYD